MVLGRQVMLDNLRGEITDKPLLSIVTVVFNNDKTLERTIQSVFDQTYKNIEYIIIDGGSTDGTLEIIKKYADKLAYWVSETDQGMYDAMNKGIRLAKGKWIHILNSDDYYVNNKVLEKVIPNLKDPNKYFYYFSMWLENIAGREIYKYKYSRLKHWLLYYSAYLPHPTMFVAKEQYDKIGLFDLNFKIAADHDLILRLCRVYRPKFVGWPVAVMQLGGLSGQNMQVTFTEFAQVTVKNGLNRHLANLIYRFKILKYNLLNKKKQK